MRAPVSLLFLLAAACGAPRPPMPPPEVFKPPELPPSNPRAVQLRGRVLGPDGAPLANVPVLVIAGGHTGERPLTNAAGEFRVSGLPPTLEGYVAVHVPGYAVAVREPVRIVERNPDGITLRLEPECVLEGVVTDPEGHPLAGARVEIQGERRLKTHLRKGATWEAVAQIDTLRTDGQGRFRFAGLYPGAFELTAHWPHALDATATTKARAGQRDVSVRIDPKEREQVLFVGRVLDAATKGPLAGVEVEVSATRTDADPSTGGDPAFLEQSSITAADGSFVLGPFPPALFRLEARLRRPGTRDWSVWSQSGARDPGLHRLEIELDRD